MILEEDAILRTRITGALAPEGVDVLSFGRLAPAKEAARRANVDILVLGETIEGRLASDVALLAEWRNPRLGSILLSDRDADAAEELFDLIPSLQAVLARGTGARTLARVAIATARSQEGIVLLQDDDWTAGDTGAPAAWEEPVQAAVPVAQPILPPREAPVPEPVASLVEEAPVPSAPVPEAASDLPAIPPVAEAPAPIRIAGPVPVQAPEPVALAVQPSEPAASVGVLESFRDRLTQAQERLAVLEAPAPAQELPTRRSDDASGGLLYVLPTFLRDSEDPADMRDDLAAPHPALLPVAAATPRRRLHLA